MRYYPTIGLEIHAELLTESKIFCSCSAAFGGNPNSRCCPVCSGIPGTLPVLNKKAVEYIIRAGYVTNCEISRFTKWERKNYFYPDLPKAYQVSQMPRPVCLNGYLDLDIQGTKKRFRINRIHLEEDAGKLVHDEASGNTLADYNRGGIPLIELVTEPDFHSAEEVVKFVETIRQLYVYAGICDGRMEQGSLRCDVNISIAPEGSDKLGTRTEIKNLNSVRSIARAIEYEIYRQAELLDAGEKVIQQTRRFVDATGETIAMRSKEDAHDYRYFPDPDIPSVLLSEEDLARIKSELPMGPLERYKKYTEKYGLNPKDADILIADKRISDFYNQAVEVYPNPKTVANFILVELLRRINLGEADLDTLPFTAVDFARLVKIMDTEKINKNNGKTVLRIMLETGKKPDEIAEEQNLWIQQDNALIERVVTDVLAANPAAVEQYKNGETKVFGFLMGQCNKQLKGSATPNAIKEILEKKLGE